jgi:hypothetical protein
LTSVIRQYVCVFLARLVLFPSFYLSADNVDDAAHNIQFQSNDEDLRVPIRVK